MNTSVSNFIFIFNNRFSFIFINNRFSFIFNNRRVDLFKDTIQIDMKRVIKIARKENK